MEKNIMNNRLKFRVRHKNGFDKGNEVAFTCQIDQDGQLWQFDTKLNNDDFIIEFCTGLKDKNGKLIYEGDVVRHKNGNQPVEWHDSAGAWLMNLSDFVFDQEYGVYDSKDIEIIGNIHEDL